MLSTTKYPVTNFSAMIGLLTGISSLLACLVPTDCLRSLENWLPFQRAFRQYVGNPEAICSVYDEAPGATGWQVDMLYDRKMYKAVAGIIQQPPPSTTSSEIPFEK